MIPLNNGPTIIPGIPPEKLTQILQSIPSKIRQGMHTNTHHFLFYALNCGMFLTWQFL